jgi:hypothetical protein
MPLILAPSYDDHTREQIEAYLEQVRIRRIAGAFAFQQSKMMKLESQKDGMSNKLARNYRLLGSSLYKLEAAMVAVEKYLNACQMIHGEVGFIEDRIEAAKR